MFLATACKDSSYLNDSIPGQEVNVLAETYGSKPAEYIIVIASDTSIETAVQHLQKYQVTVLRDLERGRYLINLVHNPDFDQLQAEIDAISDIVFIQPNHTYTTQ